MTHPSLPAKPAKRSRKTGSQVAASKALLFAALAKGCSQAEAAKIAGCTVTSAANWLRQAKAAGTDLSRERALNLLSQKIEDPQTAPQYVTPMVNLLAELNGWKARKEEKIVLKPMSDLFKTWQAEQIQQDSQSGQVDRIDIIGPSSQAGTEQSGPSET